MVKPIIMLSFLLLPLVVFAQSGKGTTNKHSSVARKNYRGEAWTISGKASLKYTPSSLLDIYGAMLPLGFEYYFQEKFGIDFDLSIPLYYVLNNSRGELRKIINSDFKLRLGVRQYFRLRERNRMYMGAEIFFRQQEMQLEDSYLHFVDGNCYPYSSIRASKSAYGIGIFAGYSRKLSDHFLLEAHLGAGLRMINMKSDLNINNSNSYQEKTFQSIVPPNEDRIGDRDINIYLPFAIKIGYLF